jgi:hypothetical protein
MALVAPILLLIIAGGVNVGHFMYVRYRLSDHAGAAARACALANVESQQCADNTWSRVRAEIPHCGWLRVRVQREGISGLTNVQGLRVRLECRYNVGIARRLMNWGGVTLPNINVAALMPF